VTERLEEIYGGNFGTTRKRAILTVTMGEGGMWARLGLKDNVLFKGKHWLNSGEKLAAGALISAGASKN